MLRSCDAIIPYARPCAALHHVQILLCDVTCRMWRSLPSPSWPLLPLHPMAIGLSLNLAQ